MNPWLWATWYGRNLIVTLTIGSLIHVLFALLIRLVGGARAIRRWKPWQRTAFSSGTPLLGVAIGWPVGVALAGGNMAQWFLSEQGSRIAIGSIALSLLITFLMHHFFATKQRQFAAEKQAAEAQLRLLQGQMEPHFMFNTLANVLSLMECDTPRARQMLEAFIDYLRASLGRLRAGDSTLGDELAMAEAYLSLMHTRMGDRLTFRIELSDPALRGAVLPPLLLQPLVENAIHHGLECKVEGGEVAVTARRDGPRVTIEVADNGLGDCERPARRVGAQGNGVALENLRARLLARYGNDAALTLHLSPDAGARATITLPFETATA